MSKQILFAGAVLAALIPATAFAQTNAQGGAAAGAATGAVGGAVVGGPVGAAVGGVAGAIVGGIVGDQQPKFREYVVTQKPKSFKYESELRVGAELPTTVTYYEIPAEYKVKGDYRYTVVNETPVIVDPGTRRVVQVIR